MSSSSRLSVEGELAPAPPEIPQDDGSLRFKDVGIWTTIEDVKVPRTLKTYLSWRPHIDFLDALRVVIMFAKECSSVGPFSVILYFLTCMWAGTEGAVHLYFSSRILDVMQRIIVDREMNPETMVIALASQIVFTLACCIIRKIRVRVKATLSIRVRYIFEDRLIQASLRLDLPTFEEPETASKVNGPFESSSSKGAWELFHNLVERIQRFATVASEIGVIAWRTLSSHSGAQFFTVLWLGKSLVDHFYSPNIYRDVAYLWDSNPHHRRMLALLDMIVHADPRIEIVSNVIGKHIQKEWRKARDLLGEVSDDQAQTILYLQRPLLYSFLEAIASDFPLMFYAYQVLRSPASFSLTSIALMQQTSTTLVYKIDDLIRMQSSLQQCIDDIRNLYDCSEIPNKILDGELGYPQGGTESSPGMALTFQNVSFAYPNSDNVINDVSFTIESGKTVIIVGVNGSGKSTLLKLFNRLYDPAAGTILVDGVPMSSFNCGDLRRASAMLFQKFSHYPLSIMENIILGRPEEENEVHSDKQNIASKQEELAREAARLGGALDFIEEQPSGFETVLQPKVLGYYTSTRKTSEILDTKVKEINKQVELSAGQWQRLALSRLLYRAAGDKIKLVAVDEPSASLDPKMEYELFESLRELSTRKRKTVVFVTHRFGYLTTRADLILVMEKGRVIEQGNHEDLMDGKGEYARLYNLQADAFVPSDDQK